VGGTIDRHAKRLKDDSDSSLGIDRNTMHVTHLSFQRTRTGITAVSFDRIFGTFAPAPSIFSFDCQGTAGKPDGSSERKDAP
jgi:hypothetical protein